MKRGLAAAFVIAAFSLHAHAQEQRALDLFVRADKGHCIACHQLPAGHGPESRNDVGPRLEGARMRSLGREALHDILQDPTRRNPESVMPPYARHRLLEPAEIERLTEFLHALPEQDRTEIAGHIGAATVPAPVYDPTAAASVVEAGKKLWTRKFRNGKTLASCFPNGGRRIAATYPQFDPRVKRVVTFEMAVNQCLKANGEPLVEPGESEAMGALTAYARSLSDGQKVNVRVPAAGEERLQEGRRLYFTRLGQRNYACASCHVQSAGKRYDGALLPPSTAQGAHWPLVREGRAVTMQMRMRECLERMGAAPFAFASEELNNLEYFLTYLSNGTPMKANAARPAS